MRIFLPWSEPFLPAVANCLLDECTQNSPASFDADLGGQVIVLRGRNAGRRLLALLAAEAQRRGRALIPPRMVTPGSLDSVLAGNKEKVAGRLLQRLAWAQVVTQSDQATLHSVWAAPAGQERTTALGRFLDQVWRELSTSGTDFSEAYRHLCQIAPEASVHEETRWTALDQLCGAYRQCLKKWGKIDPADSRREQSTRTAAKPDVQVVLVGVVELAPALVSLLRELPRPPRICIHAPGSEATGFDAWGRLVPGYWERRPCRFENGEIHVASDAPEQARRCAELIQCWNESGLPCAAITLAVPESGTLSLIEHHLRDNGIPVRLAEGRPVAHSMVFQLLALWADCLDLGPESPLRYSALASLVRHPDVEKGLGYSAKKLDEYYNAHLPERLDPSIGGDDGWIGDLLARVGELIRLEQESFAEDVTRLLLKVYGERRLNRHGPEDRATIYALEAIRGTLEEWKSLPREALRNCSPADLLRVIIETAGSTGIPSPEFPEAVELAGWLEAAADDSPALIVTSVFEGSLPEGTSAEPLLHDALRERLGLPCRSSRFARDQYTLWTVTESRRANGRVALIAPRRNATGEPTRPSRLLLGGGENEALATRLIALSSSPKKNPNPTPGGNGFQVPEPDPERMRQFRIFRPTCFRTYLESPRLFYFKYILGLGDANDDAQEMDSGMFGTAVHAILREYGAHWLCKNARPSSAQIEAELHALLETYMERNFGHHALPPVHAQQLALSGRLRMFAKHQAAAFEEGWQIAYVESDTSLTVPWSVDGAPAQVQLKGKIDRIDRHPDGYWRVIDYKTASKAQSPEKAHYPSEKTGWKDLQLPLYLHLLPAIHEPIDSEKTELVYFNLPPELDAAGITEPFPKEKIPAAWEKAEGIVREVCSGAGCQEIGKMSPFADPAFVALCDMNGLCLGGEEEEE